MGGAGSSANEQEGSLGYTDLKLSVFCVYGLCGLRHPLVS